MHKKFKTGNYGFYNIITHNYKIDECARKVMVQIYIFSRGLIIFFYNLGIIYTYYFLKKYIMSIIHYR